MCVCEGCPAARCVMPAPDPGVALAKPSVPPLPRPLQPGVVWPKPGLEVFLRDFSSPELLVEKNSHSMDLTRERILSFSFCIHMLCRVTPKIWSWKPESFPPTSTRGVREQTPRSHTNLRD